MNNAPKTRSSFVETAGLLCLVGAAIGVVGAFVTAFVPPAVPFDRYSYPYTAAGFVVAQSAFLLNHALLLAGIIGLARSGAAGPGVLGRVGLWTSLAGMVALALCEVLAVTLADAPYPSPGTDLMDTAYGVATILIGVGLTLGGIAVARAGYWEGWRRFAPLSCGVAVFVVVLPGVFGPSLAGRLAIAAWMLTFAGLGWALYARAQVPEVEPPAAAAGSR